MRIGVIGAGGTGGLYGGLLARAGHEVAFLARGAHLAAIKQRGLEVRSADFGTFVVQARASDDPRELGQSELVLMAVKTFDLDSGAHAALEMLAPDGHALTLQNGVDAPDRLAAVVGDNRVLIGTTALETTIVEAGVIGHLTPGHVINVASFIGPPSAVVEQVVQTLKNAGMNANVVADGHRALWEKAFLLIPMALLTSVCQSAIGPIRELPETRAFAALLLDDVARVSAACGYDLSHLARIGPAVLDRAPATMKASLARDFERGRRTELDALSGALVRLADLHAVEIPATRIAHGVLKLREQQAAGAGERAWPGTASE
jgi:2-dehydropantoate 2-reductase